MKKKLMVMMLVLASMTGCNTVGRSKTSQTIEFEQVLETEPITTETEIEIITTESATTEPVTTETEWYEIVTEEPTTEEIQNNLAEVEFLADLINKEASVNWEGKLMVGSTVVNRMNYFNCDVYTVVYMPNQFTTASILNGYYTELDYEAAKYVLENGTYDSRVFFFESGYDGTNVFSDIGYNYIGNF